MTRLAKAMSAFTHGRSASVAAGRDARSFATRGASLDADGSGALPVGRGAQAIFLALVACILAALLAPLATAATKKVDHYFPKVGTAGVRGGQFNAPRDIAVSQAAGHTSQIYVVDSSNNRIQRFATDGTFQRAWGGGVVVGGATGTGTLSTTTNPTVITAVTTTFNAFAVNQIITGSGIPADTRITAVGSGTITLSQPVTASGVGVPLTVATGAGNVATNEQQTVTVTATGGNFKLRFTTPNPSAADQTTANIPFNATAAVVQSALEGLSNVGAGNISVSSPNPTGGPYTVEFQGARFADTDVSQMTIATGSPALSGGTATVATQRAGGSVFEICTSANDCKIGLAAGGNSADSLLNGAMSAPQGVAVNHAGGEVYVRDRGNNRVSEYTADGAFVRSWGWDVDASSPSTAFEVCPAANRCKVGVGGNGDGQFGTSGASGNGIAIHPVTGDVFAVDPGSGTAPANRRIQQFEADGDFLAKFGEPYDSDQDATGHGVPPGQFGGNAPFYADPLYLAVDADGIVYASDGNNDNRVQRYDSVADLWLESIDVSGITQTASRATSGLEIDPTTGNLLVLRAGTVNPALGIFEFGTPGGTPTLLDTHFTDSGLAGLGFGIDSAKNELLVSSDSGSPAAHRVYVLDDTFSSPSATVLPPTNVTDSSVTFQGTVNPDGFLSSYRWQLSTDGIKWNDVTAEVSVGEGTSDVAVSDNVTGLKPNTLYRVRLAIKKGFGAGTGFSPELVFTTDAIPPLVTTYQVTERTAASAELVGSINPNGSSTTYRFEYGLNPAYGSRVPVDVDASAGSGTEALAIVQHLSGLQPDATYHYRLVADNGVDPDSDGGNGTAVFGADRTFVTRSPQPAPPGRAYELVSPADKVSGNGVGLWHGGDLAPVTPDFASADGERYVVSGDTGNILVSGAYAYANDYAFAERQSDDLGWQSHSPFTHPNAGPAGNRFAYIYETSDDISLTAWSSNGGNFKPFPEMIDFGSTGVTNLADWQGRWEVFGPTDPAQGSAPSAGGGKAIAADGSYAAMTSQVKGLAGPTDPTLDIPSNGDASTYIDDVSAGLSDSFPGEGVRTLVGTCDAGTRIPIYDDNGTDAGPAGGPFNVTGHFASGSTTITTAFFTETTGFVPGHFVSGTGIAPGTRVVSVDSPTQFTISIPTTEAHSSFGNALTVGQSAVALADDTIEAGPCPAPAPGRDAALVSMRGTTMGFGNGSDVLANTISRDGSRLFFRSPDDSGAPLSCSAASGTSCPPQLYVRQRNVDGSVATRWISRSAVPDQDPSLVASVDFEGATPDGDKVFFSTTSPLTPDDPNTGGTCSAPCTVGKPSATSRDLYIYDLADGNDPAGAGATLTRITGGPNGSADPNLVKLRFASDDGRRVYLTTAAPIPGASTSAAGGISAPGGTAATVSDANLYLYDATDTAPAWDFVARLPRESPMGKCATEQAVPGDVFGINSGLEGFEIKPFNCVRGTADAGFIAFFTDGRLVDSDPDTSTGDMYGFDAVSGELNRLSAPQGGSGAAYGCVTTPPLRSCFGIPGLGKGAGASMRKGTVVVTHPQNPGDRIAFFGSKSQLVAEDTDGEYDVYEWRNGALSLFSTGIEEAGAYYSDHSTDGEDVFFFTTSDQSWQDNDAVMDVYDARVGGGIPEVPAPPPCMILADACQGAPAVIPATSPASSEVLSGAGNVVEKKKGKRAKKKKGKRAKKSHRCVKGKVRKGKKCVTKKAHRAMHATGRAGK